MAYNTKEIVKDKDGNPISQYFNPTTNQYEPVEGSGGGNKVVLYNEDGTENNSLSLIPILDKLDQLTGTVIDEETRKASELVRISNEDTRIINEDVRIGNEIDRGDTFTTQMNRVAQIEQQVPENIVIGMANLDSDIKDLAGIGRTTQTVKGNYDDLVAHKAEIVSQTIMITRDVSLTGTQRVATNRNPKMIIVTSSVNGTKKMSVGSYGSNTVQRCLYQVNDSGLYASGGFAVIVADASANRTFGSINNITDDGFDIVWSHSGTGATGTLEMAFTIMYHGE